MGVDQAEPDDAALAVPRTRLVPWTPQPAWSERRFRALGSASGGSSTITERTPWGWLAWRIQDLGRVEQPVEGVVVSPRWSTKRLRRAVAWSIAMTEGERHPPGWRRWLGRTACLATAGISIVLLVGYVSLIVEWLPDVPDSSTALSSMMSTSAGLIGGWIPVVLSVAVALPVCCGDPWGRNVVRFLPLDTASLETLASTHQEIARLAHEHPDLPLIADVESQSAATLWMVAGSTRPPAEDVIRELTRQQFRLLEAARDAGESRRILNVAIAEPVDEPAEAGEAADRPPDPPSQLEYLLIQLHDQAAVDRATARDIRAANKNAGR